MEVQIFNHPELGQIRTMMMPDGQVGFAGKDVAEVLGYSNARDALRKHVDDEDKAVAFCDSLGGKQQTTFINESGLYSLILSSKLPQAREFKRWVTAEVLPQVRRTGGYIPVRQQDDEKTILCKALMIYRRTIEEKDALLAEQKPKVAFADALTGSEDSILISEMAKLLTQNGYVIGRTRFFAWLRKHGYIFLGSTAPIQKWVERGIFTIRVTPVITPSGTFERLTTRVTGKGQRYFVDGFLGGQFTAEGIPEVD